MSKQTQLITLVGAGIVNLINAYYLAKEGYRLKIIDKCPDPLNCQNWKEQGATHGGMNARMYSLTEADNYNEKNSKIYSNMTAVYEQSIENDGWRVKTKLEAEEEEWIQAFKNVSPRDAKGFSREIYQINIQAGKWWDELIQTEPVLFENVNLRPGIIRVYSSEVDFKAAQKLHQRLDSFQNIISGKDMDQYLPCFRYAKDSGKLGGVMKVRGFTLQVHDFCKNLISFLKTKGVEFEWGKRFEGVIKNEAGNIAGILVNGEHIHADHFVVSTGAYAGKTFDNLFSRNKIHGVLGVWLTLPDVYGLKHSFKIHKEGHVGEDTNVTLVEEGGKRKLVLGSGYGYVGSIRQNEVSIEKLKPIFNSLIQTAKTYFREAYNQALSERILSEGWKYCIRPFTSNGLGIFEVGQNVEGGHTFITGGHNTGGFTQAPVVAQSILEYLEQQQTHLAFLYHPERKTPENETVDH